MAEPEIPVRKVTLWLCDLCLNGAGGECHTPGCALWINRAPDLPLLRSPMVTVHPEPGAVPSDAFPLTCGWCSNSPATHLAVADWRFKDGPQRLQHMLCHQCAHQVIVLPAEVEGWWLFALAPDEPARCAVTP